LCLADSGTLLMVLRWAGYTDQAKAELHQLHQETYEAIPVRL